MPQLPPRTVLGSISTPIPGEHRTQALPIATAGVVPKLALQARTTPPSISSYNYVGCYRDSNQRVLNQTTTAWPRLNVDFCCQWCANVNITNTWCGVENGVGCYCDTTFNSSRASSLPASACDSTCRGSGNDYCGGSAALGIYQRTVPVITTAATPVAIEDLTVKNVTNYSHLGCYAVNGLLANSTTMALLEPQFCCDYCLQLDQSLTYCGVRNGGFCNCGASLNNAPSPTAASECSASCPGAPTNKCGGPERLDIYMFTGSPTGASSMTSMTSSATTPSSNPGSSGGPSLSGGAIAGIVVGVVAAVLLGLAVVWFAFLRRHRQRQQQPQQQQLAVPQAHSSFSSKKSSSYQTGGTPQEPESHELQSPPPPSELPTNSISELPATEIPREM